MGHFSYLYKRKINHSITQSVSRRASIFGNIICLSQPYLPERCWSPCSPSRSGESPCSPWSCVCVVCTGDRPWNEESLVSQTVRWTCGSMSQASISAGSLRGRRRYSHGTAGDGHGVGVSASAGAYAAPLRINPRIRHIGGVGSAWIVHITVGTTRMQIGPGTGT